MVEDWVTAKGYTALNSLPGVTSPLQAAVVSWEFSRNQERTQMLKSTLIAQCLYQCKLISNIKHGEFRVEEIFTEYFPGYRFEKWNTHIPENVITYYLKESKAADTIRVDSFIKELWDL
ncbi:hypothetical protein [Erwinia pyrifoliae]|uniref:hypothetical protein n=1 Tax=Erwinia pyrifoliae TaxID=79967 RepID=UPI001CF59EBB|nr:hypothetical protein [Erwinia pyrifoliae]UWS30800.1 hypothetical protein NYP81_04870 [Erwinia pyrifoliae]UXK13814.1 hypothetical protein NYP80_08445 [Erwinia pyrifoliae]